jgi:glycosyltransferase involved in cell wall biosynthesis
VSLVISERDNGIYDAMNKGLRLATGDVIGFLNADDVYAKADVIEKVAEQFANGNVDTLYGDLQYVDAKDLNRVLRNWVSGNFRKLSFKFGWMPPHPTFFVSREVYDEVGGFNLSFRMASDYELMLRILYKYQFNAVYLHEVLVKMRVGGISNGSLKRRLVANKEDRMAWKVNKLNPYFFTLYLKPLRKLSQYMNKEQLRRVPVFRFLF